MAYVYRHIRLDKNEPFYIGISKRDSPTYERAYCSYSKHRNTHWLNVFNKTEIEVDILFDNIPYDVAKVKEIEFIELYKRVGDGGTLVNLTKGGDGVLGFKNPKLAERNKTGIWTGRKHTEETKKIISAKGKGKIISTEQRLITSKRAKEKYQGVNNPKYRGIVYVHNNKEILHRATFPLDAANFAGVSIEYVNKCLGKRANGYKGFYFTRNIDELPKCNQ